MAVIWTVWLPGASPLIVVVMFAAAMFRGMATGAPPSMRYWTCPNVVSERVKMSRLVPRNGNVIVAPLPATVGRTDRPFTPPSVPTSVQAPVDVTWPPPGLPPEVRLLGPMNPDPPSPNRPCTAVRHNPT